MLDNPESRQLQYGDLIYLELNTINSISNPRHIVLCSDGFLDQNIYGIENKDIHKGQFMNCVYRVLPGLIDNNDERELLKHLEDDKNNMPNQKSKVLDMLNDYIEKKTETLKFKEKSTAIVNGKIFEEVQGKSVRFGEIIVFEHYLSGTFLCAHNTGHHTENNLLAASLTKTLNQACSFRLFPTSNNSQSEIIEFEVEVALISFDHGTRLATIGNFMQSQDQNASDIQKDDGDDDSIFPFDSTISSCPIESFPGKKYPIGFRYEKKSTSFIRIFPYCKNIEIKKMMKNKIIKNGDIIRIAAGDYYLTASKSPYKTTLSLNHHKVKDYPYHSINTLFQIIASDPHNPFPLPIGKPIQANPNKSDIPDDVFNIHIRHFATGLYITSKTLVDKISNDNKNLPFFQMIHTNLSNPNNQVVIKNALVALKFVDNGENQGNFLISGRIEPTHYCKHEKQSSFFIGCKDTEEYVNEEIKLNKKMISTNPNIGTHVRILPVHQAALKDILHCESYHCHIKKFMDTVLQYKNHQQNPMFNHKMSEIIYHSEEFLGYLMDENIEDIHIKIQDLKLSEIIPNFEKQIYLRELKILDIINRLIYYLTADNICITPKNADDFLKIDLLYELINILISIILLGIKENTINHKYNSQYIRIYINALLNTKGFVIYGDLGLQDKIKYKFCSLLLEVLWDADADNLSEILNYQDDLIKCIENQYNFETHYIELLDHICKSKVPDLPNKLMNNFITKYLTDDKKRETLLPNILSDGTIVLKKKDMNNDYKEYRIKIDSIDHTDDNNTEYDNDKSRYMYILKIFRFLFTLSKKKSLLFLMIILRQYPIEIYINNMNKDVYKHRIIDIFQRFMMNVYRLYTSNIMHDLPNNIQLIFQGYETYKTRLYDLIEVSNNSLIHEQEHKILKMHNIDLKDILNLLKMKENHTNKDIRAIEFDMSDQSKKNVNFIRYHIHNMYNLLIENQYLDYNNLLNIHETICYLLILICKQDKHDDDNNNNDNETDVDNQNADNEAEHKHVHDHKNNNIYKLFMENHDKIFEIIDLVDDRIANLAVLQGIEQIGNYYISNEEPNATNQSTLNESANLLESSSSSADGIQKEKKSPKDINENLRTIIDPGWKTKAKLYEMRSSNQDNPIQPNPQGLKGDNKVNDNDDDEHPPFFEHKLIKLLANLIEGGNSRIVSLAIHTLQRKIAFENRVFADIKSWAMINTPKEGEDFLILIESLLGINHVYRRLKLIEELNLEKIDNEAEGITRSLRKYFENIICIMYDYESHAESDISQNDDELRKVFLSRLESCKRDIKNEIPFKWKSKLIKKNFQFVMKILNTKDILIPFLHALNHYQKYFISNNSGDGNADIMINDGNDDSKEYVLLLRYLTIIMILFIDNNKENQLSVLKQDNFLKLFHKQDILFKSIDIFIMFGEMITNNKDLLASNTNYIRDILTQYFIQYIHNIFNMSNTDNTNKNHDDHSHNILLINYYRSLIYITKCNLPKEIWNFHKIIIEKFDDLINFINNDDCMLMLESILKSKPDTASIVTNNNDKMILNKDNEYYRVPVSYLILKELLTCLLDYCSTQHKETILYLQTKLPINKLINLLANKNLEYHHELKSIIIKCLIHIHHHTPATTTITTDLQGNEQIDFLINYLLIDMSALIHLYDNEWNILINDDCFFKKSYGNMDRLTDYKNIISTYPLKTLILVQYQYHTKYTKKWEKYIFNDVFSILSKLFIHEKHRFLKIRAKKKKLTNNNIDTKNLNDKAIDNIDQNSLENDNITTNKENINLNKDIQTLFDIWLILFKKLMIIKKDNLKLLKNSREIIETLSFIPDYNSPYKEGDLNDLRQMINSYLEDISSTKHHEKVNKGKHIIKNNNEILNTSLNITNLINKYIQNESLKEKQYLQKNIGYLSKYIAKDQSCIKKLIDYIIQGSFDISKSSIVFILRLLRKIIEIENTNENNSIKHIYEWENVNPTIFQNITNAQNLLNNAGIVNAIFNILYNTDDMKLLKESVLLSIALLYGGNKNVQDKFYEEFMEDLENEIINKFLRILNDNFDIIFTKDSQINKANYIIAKNFIYERLPTIAKPDDKSGNLKTIKYHIADEYTKFSKENIKLEMDLLEFHNSKSKHQYKYTLMILFLFQSLCEGHYQPFQDFLREQRIPQKGPIHVKSFNVLSFLIYAYNELFKVINIKNIKIGTKILDLLIEALQGNCTENVTLLLKKTLLTDLSQTLTSLDNDLDLLPRGFGFNYHHEDYQELKSKSLILLLNLVERGSVDAKKMIKKFVDINVIVDFTASNLLKYTEDYSKDRKGHPNTRTMNNEEIHENKFLKDGLTGYIILKGIWESREFDKNLKNNLDELQTTNKYNPKDFKTISYMLFKFCNRRVLSIEINPKKSDKLLRLYFPKYIIFDYLSQDVKDDFEDHVDRSNTQSKIDELMSQADEFISIAKLDYDSRNRLFGLNMNLIYHWIRFIVDFIVVIVNLINLFSLTYIFKTDDNNEEAANDYIKQSFASWITTLLLNYLNILLGLIMLIIYFTSKMDKYLSRKWQEDYEENLKDTADLPVNFDSIVSKALNDGTISIENAEKVLKYKEPYSDIWNLAKKTALVSYLQIELNYLFHCPSFVWHVIFLLLCVTSNFHPIICALQLFDIVVQSDTVSRIFAAVYRNWKQFLWTLMLLTTIVYIYSLIGLYYLQDAYVEEIEDDKVISLCQDEYSCFLVHFNYGLRSGSGIADIIKEAEYDPNDKFSYFVRMLYDFSFFILCIVLLLNLIFGMIIDSFGELRDEKNQNEEDQKNICFICGLDRSEIEKYFIFEEHTLLEHNKWNYIAYIIYLMHKNEYAPTDFSDVESYVWDRYTNKDFEWVPVGRSLTLEILYEQEEKLKKNELDALKDDVCDRLETIKAGNVDIQDDIKIVKQLLVKSLYKKKESRL